MAGRESRVCRAGQGSSGLPLLPIRCDLSRRCSCMTPGATASASTWPPTSAPPRPCGPAGSHLLPPGRAVVFETLKKHRQGVYRAVPVPPGFWTSSTWCTASGRPSGAAKGSRGHDGQGARRFVELLGQGTLSGRAIGRKLASHTRSCGSLGRTWKAERSFISQSPASGCALCHIRRKATEVGPRPLPPWRGSWFGPVPCWPCMISIIRARETCLARPRLAGSSWPRSSCSSPWSGNPGMVLGAELEAAAAQRAITSPRAAWC